MNPINYSPTVLPLTLILQNDKEAINRLNKGLKTRGYVLVSLPNELVEQVDRCLGIIENFFNRRKEYKKVYVKEPIFGYFDVEHKESFRLLTGSRLDEHKLPMGFDEIKNLTRTIDQIMFTVTTASSLFPNIMEKAKELDIPLFNFRKQWGMFDFAKYHNNGSIPGTKISCKEHSDPGLLTISLRSTEPGLELRDGFGGVVGGWVKIPNNKNIGIIWAGDAAAKINPEVKPCIHRVVNPAGNNKPRIAIWHEICTSAQEHRELLNQTGGVKVAENSKANLAYHSQNRPDLPDLLVDLPDLFEAKLQHSNYCFHHLQEDLCSS